MEEVEGWNEDEENKLDSAMKFMVQEFSNHTGFYCTIKSYEGDFLSGKIIGVRHNCVQLIDDQGNRVGCDLFIVALWCIINPETEKTIRAGQMEKEKKKVKKKASVKKIPKITKKKKTNG